MFCGSASEGSCALLRYELRFLDRLAMRVAIIARGKRKLSIVMWRAASLAELAELAE